MKRILILGAGLSATSLIQYLLEHAPALDWQVTIADADPQLALRKAAGHPHVTTTAIDIRNEVQTSSLIKDHDLVISMLPAFMHIQIAQHCLHHKKHLLTASYISPEMRALHSEAEAAGLLFLNECGLDPGIDHMSAMRMMDGIRHQGGVIHSFKSYCGGLIDASSDNNPWHYKFTWNPRNVVLAGQHTASYRHHNELRFIPPSRIFTQTDQIILPNGEVFEGYANRDSLEYVLPYGLEHASTIIRGTLRVAGFCAAWNNLIQLGLTDDSFVMHHVDQLTYRTWLHAFTPGTGLHELESRVADFLKIDLHSAAFKQLQWLGIFEDIPIEISEGSPATVLQYLLMQKWKLDTEDKDRIVMFHQIGFTLDQREQEEKSSLIVVGENMNHTAMAKTVGLPLAIASKLLLENKISLRGVQMPVNAQIYNPILNELESYGIRFE